MVLAIGFGLVVILLIAWLFIMPSWIRRHPSSRGSGATGAGFLGIGDELFHPAAQESRQALDEQSRLLVPAPSPDGDKGISDGRVRITVEGR